MLSSLYFSFLCVILLASVFDWNGDSTVKKQKNKKINNNSWWRFIMPVEFVMFWLWYEISWYFFENIHIITLTNFQMLHSPFRHTVYIRCFIIYKFWNAVSVHWLCSPFETHDTFCEKVNNVMYDAYKCERISSLRKHKLPTFHAGDWSGGLAPPSVKQPHADLQLLIHLKQTHSGWSRW